MPLLFPMGFIGAPTAAAGGTATGSAGSEGPSLTFKDFEAATNSAKVYTFSTMDLGTATANRAIIITVNAEIQDPTPPPVGSLSIDGIAATNRVDRQDTNNGVGVTAEIWQATVPSGISGTVSVSFSATMRGCTIGVYRLITTTTTPANTGSDASPTSPLSMAATVPSGGAGVAVGTIHQGISGTEMTMSGITENYDTDCQLFRAGAGTISSSGTKQFSSSDYLSAGASVYAAWTLT